MPTVEDDALMRPIINHSPLQAYVGFSIYPDGRKSLTAVAKATFSIPSQSGAVCRLASEQLEPLPLPTYVGERWQSSILRPADVVPYKPGTDVVLIGHAYAPKERPVTELSVSVKVADLHKSLVVVGDRQWHRAAGELVMTKPEPFVRMPLVYERAFGGCPPSQREKQQPDHDQRNPVGTGYCVVEGDADGMRLPNLEAPEARITSWRSVPPVAGFGAIDAHWAGRRRFAGTFDTTWRATQFPRMPLDLDPRFHCVASPGLGSSVSLFGPLDVELVHLTPEPVLRFVLPEVRVRVDFHLAGFTHERRAELWTIVIEPDGGQVTMTWGARCRFEHRRRPTDHIEIRTEPVATAQILPHAS